MAHIRAHDTAARKRGKPVKRFEVIWQEPVRDDFGLPVPLDPERPDGPKKMRPRQESYASRDDAQARVDELNAARHTIGTSSLAEQKKAGDLPFGHYAQAWLDTLAVRVQQGTLKQRGHDDSLRLLRCYVLDRFGGKAIASITAFDAEQFVAALATQPSRRGGGTLAVKTVTHAWNTFRSVMRYAQRHKAIASNPCDSVDFAKKRAVGDKEKFEHHPLTARQTADLAARITRDGYPVYGLMATFLAYTGLRASENTGLEIRDVVIVRKAGKVKGEVRVRRTKARRNGEWVVGTPKSKRSTRTVPLPGWLAARMADYLERHPRAGEPSAPLWPSRVNGGGYRKPGERYTVPFDWAQPIAMSGFYDTIMKPALEAIGLPASRPAAKTRDGAEVPAVKGVRLHDLRHTFAVMQLMNGEHYMKVADMMGHATRTLVLDVYGDWIPEDEGGNGNNLPEPPAIAA